MLQRVAAHTFLQANSLAAAVVARAAARDGGGGSATLQYSLSRRVPLSGRELADYYEAAEQQVSMSSFCIHLLSSPVTSPHGRCRGYGVKKKRILVELMSHQHLHCKAYRRAATTGLRLYIWPCMCTCCCFWCADCHRGQCHRANHTGAGIAHGSTRPPQQLQTHCKGWRHGQRGRRQQRCRSSSSVFGANGGRTS
jgi:hypothetical protein